MHFSFRAGNCAILAAIVPGLGSPPFNLCRRWRSCVTRRREKAMAHLPKPKLRRASQRRNAIAPPQAEPEAPRIEQIDAEGLRWVNIERPGPAERDWLEEHFEFHALDLEDVLSRNQRPKIDEYEDYLFIVLHFPVFDPTVGRLNAGELDIFIGPDFLVTLPNAPLHPVEYLFERCRSSEETREQLMSKGPGLLLYKIVDR